MSDLFPTIIVAKVQRERRAEEE